MGHSPFVVEVRVSLCIAKENIMDGRQSTPVTFGAAGGAKEQVGVALKRLTIDVPGALHARLKLKCAGGRRTMGDETV
jgi:hypothetical protein